MRTLPAAFLLVTAVALAWPRPAPATQMQTDAVVTTTHVAGSVYMLEGRGGNIGVCAGTDGILIIDDQYATMAESIRAALKTLHPGELRFILNTHFHGDHTGGNAVFGSEGTIIAHENVRTRLATPQQIRGQTRAPIEPVGWPVVTFAQAVTVHFNGEDIRFVHMPAGHTDGDGVVYFPKSNVLHMGDLLFTGRFPYIDTEHGGSVEGYAAALARVLEMFPADAKVIPGHGPLSTMDDVRKMHDMFVATRAHVRTLADQGKSLEEIKAAGLPGAYASFAWEFVPAERWIDTLHNAHTR